MITNVNFFSLEKDLEEILKGNNSNQEILSTINNLFQIFIEDLANDDKTIFHNFYSKYKYAILKLNLPEEIEEEFNYFRRFLNEKHKNLNSNDIKNIRNTFLFLVSYIKQEKEGILKYNKLNNFYFTNKYYIINIDLNSIDLVVDSFSDILEFKGHTYFIISGFIKGTGNIIKIRLNKHIINLNGKNKVIDFLYIKNCIEKGTNINFKNLGKIENEENKFFSIPGKTLIVIEPDYLIEASSLGRSFDRKGKEKTGYPQMYLNNLLFPFNSFSIEALGGILVGNYLDSIIKGKNYSLGKLIEKEYLNSVFGIKNDISLDIIKYIFYSNKEYIEDLVLKTKNKRSWIEPTYYSNKYGLSGRIDLLFQDNGKINLIELKSGTPADPKFQQTQYQHKMQSVCYNMMLESTYGIEKKGNTAIYYSKNTEKNKNPMRIVLSEYDEHLNILNLRNEIISIIIEIGNKNYNFLEKIIESKNIDSLFFKIYKELLSFSFRELLNGKIGLYNNPNYEYNSMNYLWNKSIEEKKEKFILLEMNLENIDEEEGLMYFEYDILNIHSFRINDMIIVYPEINGKYKPLKNHILKGTIKSINENKIIIKLSYEQNSYETIKTYNKWVLEYEFYEAGYKQIIGTLKGIIDKEKEEKLKITLGINEPKKNYSKNEIYIKDLNEYQNNIINNALNAKNYYLLQGPPGTGKTSTFLINYIRETLKVNKNNNYKIFVTAFTNKAVETICKSLDNPRIGDKIKYINFGGRGDENNPNTLKNIIKNTPLNEWFKIILENNVFVCTVNQFYSLKNKFNNDSENKFNNDSENKFNNDSENKFKFNEIIIDEASQLTDASLLGILLEFDKFILIGDHLQLPAVITQNEELLKINDKELNNLGINNLGKSSFERLFINAHKKGWKESYGQFINHYRMHKEIANLIEFDYLFGLKEGTEKQKNENFIHNCFGNILDYKRTIFINKKKGPPVKKDTNEANIIYDIIVKIIDEGIYTSNDIGIVSPFKAQISEIKRLLIGNKYKGIQIDTVERYQGDEKKIIIYTSTINSDMQIKSIQNEINIDGKIVDRKFLVAISRAIEQIIIIGNENVLNNSLYYKNIIQKIKEKGGFINQKNL